MNNMADFGFKTWANKFTWEKITKEYENLYEELDRISFV